MNTRESYSASIVVGRKHTGKSTLLAGIADAYPGKVLIMDVNGSPAYNKFRKCTLKEATLLKSGKVRLLGTPDEETLKVIADKFRGGLVIFEDCTKYIGSYVKPEIKTFLVDHRMMNCDLIFTFHSFKRIPPLFWEMTSYITILKTQDNFVTARNREMVPNFDEIAVAYNQVMASSDNYYSKTVETLV
jgi:hypothetical protein